MKLKNKYEKYMEKIIEPAVKFMKNISGKALIVIDDDSDGCCSGAIIALIIKKLYNYVPKFFSTEIDEPSLTKKVVDEIKKEKPDYIIFCDIPSIPLQFIDELKKISKILIIDHHSVVNYKTSYCNPKIYINAFIPTSYIAYRIYKKILNTNDVCWIAGIGVLGDYGVQNCKDLFSEIKSRYYDLINKAAFDNVSLYEKSKLGILAKMTDAAKIIKGKRGVEFVSKILVENEFDEILNGRTKDTKKILKWYNLLKKEFEKTVNDFRRNHKSYGKIVFYEIKSKYKIKGSFGAYVEKFFDDKIIVICQTFGKKIGFSLRKGKKLKTDLSIFAKKIIKGIPGGIAGGHAEAAAGKINKKYYKKFLENLVKMAK